MSSTPASDCASRVSTKRHAKMSPRQPSAATETITAMPNATGDSMVRSYAPTPTMASVRPSSTSTSGAGAHTRSSSVPSPRSRYSAMPACQTTHVHMPTKPAPMAA